MEAFAVDTSFNETTDIKVDLFDIEAKHNENECQIWMKDHWAIGWYCSVIYIIVVLGLKRYMRDRVPYELRYSLAFWSGSLAVFSMMGTARMWPKLFEDITQRGFHFALCDNSFMTTKPTSYWGYVFTISKLIELGDTLFIVLRKQQLIFLHYYHHITVLLYVWYSYPQRPATSRWFALMNFSVHSLMYSYYTLRAMKVKIPRFVNVFITFLQIVQMIIGLVVNLYTAAMLRNHVPCAVGSTNVQLALAMYLSYFALFLKFFFETYIVPNRQYINKRKTDQDSNPKPIQNGHTVINGHSKFAKPRPIENGHAKAVVNGHSKPVGNMAENDDQESAKDK